MKNPALLFLLAPLLLAACAGPQQRSAIQQTPPTASAAVYTTDDWLGQWDGPEGTFLRLDGGGDDYLVTIRNLDGTRTFLGNRKGGTIQFERNGQTEKIRHTDGRTTGMKWLADKTNCLTVKKGEGYCRPEASTGSASRTTSPAQEASLQVKNPDQAQATAGTAQDPDAARQEPAASSFKTRLFGNKPAGTTPFPEPES